MYCSTTTSLSSTLRFDPYGMLLVERNFSITSENYRFGFNGYENTDELLGDNIAIDFGARVFDSRVARFFSIDPRSGEYPWQSVYVYYSNCPIAIVDVDGMGGPNKDGHSDPNGNKIEIEGDISQTDDKLLLLNTDPDRNWTYAEWVQIDDEIGYYDIGGLHEDNSNLYSIGSDTRIGMFTGDVYEIPTNKLKRVGVYAGALTLEGIYWFNKNINPWYIVPNSVQSYSTGTDLITGNDLSASEATIDIATTFIPVGKLGKLGLEVGEIVTKGGLKPLGLGSTAKAGVSRVYPVNLTEELALKEIMGNPSMGNITKMKKGMTDSRWHQIDGWQKMTWNNAGVEIHYVGQWQNGVLKAVDDFKIIGK